MIKHKLADMSPTEMFADIMKMATELGKVSSGESNFVLPKGEPLELDVTWFEDPFWCRITRPNPMGHLCGYVYIPEGHPYFGATYEGGKVDNLSVHGGITCCHPNNMQENEVIAKQSIIKWWRLGFDCFHAGDDPPIRGAKNYRNLKYVKSEVLKLHKQCEEVWK